MRIIKNLAQHKLVVLMVVVLLCVQAACDLALPNYTSDIVDTGIQQQGVQDLAKDRAAPPLIHCLFFHPCFPLLSAP